MIDITKQCCIKIHQLQSKKETIFCESTLDDAMTLLENQIHILCDDEFLHQHPFMIQIFSNLFYKIGFSVAKQWANENRDVKWHFIQRHCHLQVKLLETVKVLYTHYNAPMKKQGGCYDVTSVKREAGDAFHELYVALGVLDDEKEYLNDYDVPRVKLQPFEAIFQLVAAEYFKNGKHIRCNVKNILNQGKSSRVLCVLEYFMCLIEVILGETGEIIEEDLVVSIIEFVLDILQYIFAIMVNDSIYMMHNMEAMQVFIERLVKVVVDILLYFEDYKCFTGFYAKIDRTIDLIDKASYFIIRKSDLFAGDLTKFQHTVNSVIKTIGKNGKQIKSLMELQKSFLRNSSLPRPMATLRTPFAGSRKSRSLHSRKTTPMSHQRQESADSDAKYKRLSCFDMVNIRFIQSSEKSNSYASVDNGKMNGSCDALCYKQLSFGSSRKPLIETKYGENEYIEVIFPRLIQISCIKAQVTFSSNSYGNTDKNNRLECWDINQGQYTTLKCFACPCLCGGSNSVTIYDVKLITNKMRFVTEKGFVGLSFFKVE